MKNNSRLEKTTHLEENVSSGGRYLEIANNN